METKRLYRSKKNRVVAGICGGLGDYLNTDPTILRLIWILVVILSGVAPGIIVYIVAAFLIPEK